MQRKIQTFNDGILSLNTIAEDDTISLVQGGIRFDNRTVGSKRFFEAYEFQRRADKVVRIPLIAEPLSNDIVIIEDKQFNILQVQKIKDTMPECWQLTLEVIKEGRYHVID
ncbi:MAG: hypothetical protein IJ723_07170 [Ruminococcus sp.]|nr:hypothetical protein [Ruminococcus sp.]